MVHLRSSSTDIIASPMAVFPEEFSTTMSPALQPAVGNRFFDHVAGDAILDAPHRVEELDLGKDLGIEVVH